MAKIELTLKRTYRPHWGIPEAVREFIQNWLDGDDKGFTKSMRRDGDWLVLRNEEVALPREALLLGFTTKATDADARGQWGEGLDMGLLVATRAGLDVVVYTGAERWTPKLVQSASFADEVLAVFTRQVRDRAGTEVHLRITEDQWAELQWRFLELQPADETTPGESGRIIFDADRRGCVYVKGIFVSKVEDLQHGYDFQDARVDLDRMLVNSFDVRWEAAILWETAISQSPGRNGRAAWEMLKSEKPDVAGLGSHLQRHPNPRVAKAVADVFQAEHGEDALPAADDHQMQKIEHLGRKPVRVSKSAAQVLEAHYGPFYAMLNNVAKADKVVVATAELTELERQVVLRGVRLVELAMDGLGWSRGYQELLAGLDVVEYTDDQILGTWERKTRRVGVSRRVLTDVPEFLGTYLHELAHDLTEAGDGTHAHISVAEHLWVRCMRVVLERFGMEWLDERADDGAEVRDLRQGG